MLKQEVVFLWFQKFGCCKVKQSVHGDTAKTSPHVSQLSPTSGPHPRSLERDTFSYRERQPWCQHKQSRRPARGSHSHPTPPGAALHSQASPGVCALHHDFNNLFLKSITALFRKRNCARMRKKNKSWRESFLQDSAWTFFFQFNWMTSNSFEK